MTQLSRRRFMAISAAALTIAPVQAAPVHLWRGMALGAQATIRLVHPDAAAITARAAAEITRLEGIFSLYRPASALSVLNADGTLQAPPFELLECLALSARVHAATGGLFDPTIQPLWALHAEAAVAGRLPGADEVARTLTRTGFSRLRFDSAAVRMDPGMALTLNGVAQGVIADRIADLLRAEGLTDVLVDCGELHALGTGPDPSGWPVTLASGGGLALADRALATSAPFGTVFDAAGQLGHILDPRTGRPVRSAWSSVSISAPSAGLADALSTAACLLPDRAAVQAALAPFPGTRIEALVPA